MRKVLTALLVVFICHYAAAQGRFGIKAGTTFYTLHASNDKLQDYSNGKYGYTVGATYEWVLNNYFAIQPEINYSFQVAEENYYNNKIKIGYTQIPILLHFYPKNTPVNIFLGPQLNSVSNANLDPSNGKSYGIRGKLNQTDFGGTLGVAYSPSNWKNGLTVDLRIYKGVMNVIKAEYDNGLKTRNSLVSLTVGYLFKP